MNLLVIGVLIFCAASCNLWVGNGQTTFNLLQYGAKGDGQTDDTHAVEKAWKDLCGANESSVPTLVVPAGHTFLLHQLQMKGPCRSNKLHVQILGNILAPKRDAWGACSKRWLYFGDIEGLLVDGSGMINGQGQDWWNRTQNGNDSCGGGPPTAFVFERCNGLKISEVTHANGPGGHIVIVHSNNVTISHINITAPKDSHNTDGIDLSNSEGANVHDSVIATGDDCIAIKGGAKFINITQVACGPGHGISVGSLGEKGQEDKVEEIHVWNCSFNGSSGAAKIKTWAGGKGYARAITFEHLTVTDTEFPVFIDQHYWHSKEQPGAVKVSNVTFRDINGTSADERAITLDCAKIGCDNIVLDQINITSIDPKKKASTICNNAQGIAKNTSPPVSCLSQQI